MKVFYLALLFLSMWGTVNASKDHNYNYVSFDGGRRYFTVSSPSEKATLLINSSDYTGVIRAFNDLQNDIQKVTGNKLELYLDKVPPSKSKKVIIAGTLGKSELIDKLVAQKVIDPNELKGKWEKFIIKTVRRPMPGIENALVIVGSDKRGTIYGIYDISKNIGVSPWYWWADVPVQKQESIYIRPGTYTDGEPAVKYRGIFINDESPAFRYWAKEKFGGINHKAYETIFELLLRLRANYLWPAMWLPTMFNVDDPLNPKKADEYGIVMSTSHHEPMMRAHREWHINPNGGEWNYLTNRENLQEFWRGGIERMGSFESVVTVGMRGDGDTGMKSETHINLLQTIITDQRNIIAEVTGKPANETPQVWALYKEVKDYFFQGMRVYDDIIYLLANDNWGNIRYLPTKEELKHPGGFGMYYHFDYVGAPRSYRWAMVTQIERVWEQMKLTYEHGVDRLWIVNVGDIKPNEFPISFFMDFAWNPDAIQAKDLPYFYERWARQQFGSFYTKEIANLLALYSKHNSRRTPELLQPNTFSIQNYREADRVVEELHRLYEKSSKIYEQMPETHKSAFYQLVHGPIVQSFNLLKIYVAAGKNNLYAREGRASANVYAQKVKELFAKHAELARYFHEEVQDGKWNHMKAQTVMGYTSWNHPRADVMPAVSIIHTRRYPKLGFAIEHGTEPSWGGHSVEGYPLFSQSFSTFDPINQQSFYVDVFNMGEGMLNYAIETKYDWIILSKKEGSIRYDERVYVSIDWNKAPKGKTNGTITIKGEGEEYSVRVPIRNDITTARGFAENNGVVSIEAANYTNKINTKDKHWTVVPNLGRTGSSLIIEPVNSARQILDKNSPRVEYEFTVFDAGEIVVEAYLSPHQDFRRQGGLLFAVSINDEEPQIINSNEGEIIPDYRYAEWWQRGVSNRIKIRTSKHKIEQPGIHTLKIWMIDPGIVFQKFVIDAGGKRESYLGPPESKFIPGNRIVSK